MQENSSRTSCRHFLKMSKPYEYIKTSFFFLVWFLGSWMRPAEGSLIIKDNVKGQLISKGLLESSFQPKNQQKNLRISALASKKRSEQKNKGTLSLIRGYFIWSYNKVFWFELFLKARAEILSLVFWSKQWNQKSFWN